MGLGLERDHRLDLLHLKLTCCRRIGWSKLLDLWAFVESHIVLICADELPRMLLRSLLDQSKEA